MKKHIEINEDLKWYNTKSTVQPEPIKHRFQFSHGQHIGPDKAVGDCMAYFIDDQSTGKKGT